MNVQELSKGDIAQRKELMQSLNSLKDSGICPTCKNFETHDIFPSIEHLTFYEDDLVACFLEIYPRNPGHSIVLIKPHYEDVSELPPDVGSAVYKIIHSTIACLKTVLGPEKVYLCTMCDGKRNHLHFQLIPRYKGDVIQGSKLFVKNRLLLQEPEDVVEHLGSEIKKQLRL